MITKKAIANQFKANEAFVSSLGSLTSTIKKGRYKVLNKNGQYETIYLETSANQVVEDSNKRFVSDTEKSKWNNKAEKLGNVSQDFSAKTFNVSNAILPTKDGIDIGSPQKRFRGIYVDEAYLSTNTLYIGDTPILGTNNDTITIKADPNQSITMQTKATGTTKIISEAGVELSTDGMNANVVVQAKGSNAQVNIASTSSTNIDAANVNIKGNTTFRNSVKIDGDLTVTGPNTTLSTSNLVIKDNIIELNHGQTGNGVSEGKAGIKINRGDSDAFNIVFDEADDSLKVGSESLLKTVALQEWVTSNTAKLNHTHNNYLPLSGGNLTGNLTINSKAVYHEGNKPSLKDLGAAADSHNHNSGNITALTGYSKPNATSAISTSDTLNTALGKLEKGLEGKKDIAWVPNWSEIIDVPTTFKPVSHNHSSKEILKMTGYTKGSATSAIAATDSLNAAISKLEVALDGKEATHSHPYRSDTWVPTWNDVTGKPTIISINDSATTTTNQTWSAKKIYDSLAGKAESSHTHAVNQINGLGSAAKLNAGTSANEVLKLDSTGKVPVSTLPSIAINQTFTAKDQAEALTLTIEVGDIVIVTADAKTYICVDTSKTVFDDKFKALSSGTDSITKVEVENLLKNKVDKENGKGLSTNDFTTEEKTKLKGIATGANKYVHPDDTNTRHVSDADKNNWNSKAPGNHNHDSAYLKLAGGTINGPITKAGQGSGFVIANGTSRTIMFSSMVLGEHLFGGSNDNTTEIKDYIRVGANKLNYTTGASTYNIYHEGNKPTLDDIGAAAKSHGNHVPTVETADARKFLRNDNTWQTLPTATTSATGIVQLNDAINSTSTTQAATANAVKKAYDLANGKASGSHGHNNLSSRGRVTMETNTNRPAVSGLSMSEVYNNDYPISYGNVMTMKGGGDGQLLIGWAGTSGAHAPAYIRSRRDQADANWSGWAQIYTSAHKPSLTDLGITTLTRGSYLTGSNYNGTGATTWAVDATTAATANKVVARDNLADISARSFKSKLENQSNISGAIAFRINNSDNDYIRFCSDTGAIRTFLNTYAKSETYTRSEMDSRYRQKTDMVFTDTISIITPAA